MQQHHTPAWPRITIVTPSYNQAKFLPAAMESVLSQGYPNLEYIVMDGGSTDGSVEIIRRYADRLHAWASERDGGQADAVRNGFAQSTGAILSFLNSDDVLIPGALFDVAKYFQKTPSLGVVIGAGGMIDAEGRFLYGTYPVGWGVAELLSYESRFMQPAVFYHRTAYERVGGMNQKFQFSLDLDLFVRLAAAGVPYVITYKRLAYTRLHPDTKTSRRQDVMERENAVIRSRYEHDVYLRQSPMRSWYWRAKHFLLRCRFEGIRDTFGIRSREMLRASAESGRQHPAEIP